ncbi:transcriptional regulator, GntR family [Caballeronia arationis]|uniref:Transcriptional regulator, GntR family n=1 Tax=Caballeronia arationis TaxID=1777142 RepID=A0A7Z7N3C3_9BURK|nr:PLP-dependent aminotransferase family protein [Caballeronia arationis]SOE80620.1 transcriptional regulator, GntR family [Caballeronia arationis]
MLRTSCWTPALEDGSGPTYLAIANAVAESINKGELRAGDRLPPQRALAASLGVDFTTVSRGYAEAQRRGLLEARVGRGTYVKAIHRAPASPTSASGIDMLINQPPPFDNPALEKRIWEGVPAMLTERGMEMLMRYQVPSGAMRDRLVGANWLSQRISGLGPERVLVCPGAQGALLAVSMMLAGSGDTICVEALAYPGFILLAKELGIRLAAVEMDENGALPESLDAVCRSEKPKAFYCTPIVHNPTTITMPLDRRIALVEVARRHNLPIIEDDNYWPLVNSPDDSVDALRELPSLASLAPELVYYISGLAKCVSPALRIAYLAVPDQTSADRASVVIRATASMAAPLSAAVATYWIESGLAEEMLRAIRTESEARQAIARRHLGADLENRHSHGFHLWLPLPMPWTRSAFITQLKLSGISVAGTDAFSVSEAPDGVRLCLGAPRTRNDLENCLHRIADILHLKSYEPSQVI